MKILFITAKPSYMPDSEDLGTWCPMPGTEGFYMQSLGEYHLFAHECLSEYTSERNNVTLKVEKKHAIVASWLKIILSYAQAQWGEISKEDLYLVLHDKDLLKHPVTNEGIYGEERINDVGSSLVNMVTNGHIYLFQHIDAQDMCQALINKLIEPSVKDIEQALNVINDCRDEA